MAWNPVYADELNAIMKAWDDEIHNELEKNAPTRGQAAGGKGKTDLINDKYRILLSELKLKHGIN